MAQVTVNVDKNILERANAVFGATGIDLDLAVTLMLRRTVLEGALPFDLSPVPPASDPDPLPSSAARLHSGIDAPLPNVEILGMDTVVDLGIGDSAEGSGAADQSQSLPDEVPPEVAERFSSLKVGRIANTTLRGILQSGRIPADEVQLMLTKDYSAKTFNLAFPLLVRHVSKKNTKNYYASPLNISDEEYYLCSQWYESPKNNDRPYLLRWIATHSD